MRPLQPTLRQKAQMFLNSVPKDQNPELLLQFYGAPLLNISLTRTSVKLNKFLQGS